MEILFLQQGFGDWGFLPHLFNAFLKLIRSHSFCISESTRPRSKDHERYICPNFRPVQSRTPTAHPQHAQPGSVQTASAQ